MQKKIAGMALAAGLLAGCGNVDGAHLVFGQKDVVGLGISASGPQQDAELTLGYNGKNIAVIPVAVEDNDGEYTKLESTNQGNQDAYSTLGQFELNTGGDGTVSVGLGKFFATGTAAQVLAQGFNNKLSQSDAATVEAQTKLTEAQTKLVEAQK